MNSNEQRLSTAFVQDIKGVIGQAVCRLCEALNFTACSSAGTVANGFFNEVLQSNDRAEYGAYLF